MGACQLIIYNGHEIKQDSPFVVVGATQVRIQERIRYGVYSKQVLCFAWVYEISLHTEATLCGRTLRSKEGCNAHARM